MSKVKGSIAILGSGETSPNLVTVHRRLINNLGKEVNAYMICLLYTSDAADEEDV